MTQAAVHPPQSAVDAAVELALAEDLLPLGDLSAALVDPLVIANLVIRSREDGVLAGRRCAEAAFMRASVALEVNFYLDDGDAVGEDTVVATIRGPLAAILPVERTALNFLSHLSGIARSTAKYVAAARKVNESTRILDTRKTLPGLRALQKAAVRAGGGTNHRANLSDAVMLKDNHLGALSISAAVAEAKHRWPGRMVEVECDRLEQAIEAVDARATAVLLDNMDVKAVTEAVKAIRQRPWGSSVLIEVSGRVSLERVGEYAKAGVDLISVGALTHSVRVHDFGLDFEIDGANARPVGD